MARASLWLSPPSSSSCCPHHHLLLLPGDVHPEGSHPAPAPRRPGMRSPGLGTLLEVAWKPGRCSGWLRARHRIGHLAGQGWGRVLRGERDQMVSFLFA